MPSASHYLLFLIYCMVLLPDGLLADYDSAIDAYQRHRYLEAFEQLLPLAQQGNPKAQTIIAMMHKYGEGIRLDHAAAFQWYLSAAEQDYAPAQLSVAEMYLYGQGIEADPRSARHWAKRAAEQGIERAIVLYESLEKENFDSQIKQGSRPRRHFDLSLPSSLADPNLNPISTPADSLYRVQLGAMKSMVSAKQLWDLASGPNQDLFTGLNPYFKQSEPSRGSITRLQVGPFGSLEDARHFCLLMKQRGLRTGCLPIKSVASGAP